jgi:hypothetical protein
MICCCRCAGSLRQRSFLIHTNSGSAKRLSPFCPSFPPIAKRSTRRKHYPSCRPAVGLSCVYAPWQEDGKVSSAPPARRDRPLRRGWRVLGGVLGAGLQDCSDRGDTLVQLVEGGENGNFEIVVGHGPQPITGPQGALPVPSGPKGNDIGGGRRGCEPLKFVDRLTNCLSVKWLVIQFQRVFYIVKPV